MHTAARIGRGAAYRWAGELTVYIDGGFRRHGGGTRLYRALLGQLREQRLWIADAGGALSDETSVGLHESLGFTSVRTDGRIGYKYGKWWDVRWWQLGLCAPGDEPHAEPGARPRLGAGP